MDLEYVVAQLNTFKSMLPLFYRDYKPVYWSTSAGTALAEAELEYKSISSRSVYVKFKINDNLHALIWTTTPWTLIANRAIAINPKLEYIKTKHNDDTIIVERNCYERVKDTLGLSKEYTQIDVKGLVYRHPFTGENCPFLEADWVTDSSGSGLVHMAPGHGHDDYILCKANGIQPFSPVDDYGKYTDEANEFKGLAVLTKGTQKVIDYLTDKGLLVLEEVYQHDYPHDWRTKKPVITRATHQWFCDLTKIKNKAISSLENVKSYPEAGKRTLSSFVDRRTEWCVSRQRNWGVPIPCLYKDGVDPIMTQESVSHIIQTIEKKGIESWWTDAPDCDSWIPDSLKRDKYTRGVDTLDVWFDSGTSWNVLKASLPEGKAPVADLYLEGSDQHRGWFQSSLLTYVAATSRAESPYKAILTHGYTLDSKNRKMSKSLGNVILPRDLIEGKGPVKSLGIDGVRLYVASSDCTRDISVSGLTVNLTLENLRKIRNTLKFLTGNLANWDGKLAEYEHFSVVDKVILSQLAALQKEVSIANRDYAFYRSISLINSFISELSSQYFHSVKDTLYNDGVDNFSRIAVLTTFAYITRFFLSALAPFTPLLCTELLEIMRKLPCYEELRSCSNVLELGVSQVPDIFYQSDDPMLLAFLYKLRDLANAELKSKQDEGLITNNLQAIINLSLAQKSIYDYGLADQKHVLTNFLGVSDLTINGREENGMAIVVQKSEHRKCPRCWKYTTRSEDDLCNRCDEVIRSQAR